MGTKSISFDVGFYKETSLIFTESYSITDESNVEVKETTNIGFRISKIIMNECINITQMCRVRNMDGSKL